MTARRRRRFDDDDDVPLGGAPEECNECGAELEQITRRLGWCPVCARRQQFTYTRSE